MNVLFIEVTTVCKSWCAYEVKMFQKEQCNKLLWRERLIESTNNLLENQESGKCDKPEVTYELKSLWVYKDCFKDFQINVFELILIILKLIEQIIS